MAWDLPDFHVAVSLKAKLYIEYDNCYFHDHPVLLLGITQS